MTVLDPGAPPEAPPAAESLAAFIDGGPPERRAALVRRLTTFLSTVGRPIERPDPTALLAELDDVLAASGPEEAWLALAVVSGRLPEVWDVQRLHRASRLGEGLAELFDSMRARWPGGRVPSLWPEVEVVSDRVVVDVSHTASDVVATGIQRVAREVARRWDRDHDIITIGWTRGYDALRRLDEGERLTALEGRAQAGGSDRRGELLPSGRRRPRPEGGPDQEDPTPPLVPWRCTHLVPELAAEIPRAHRYRALVEYSRCRTGVLGYDCVPLTAAETIDKGVAYSFASYLSAIVCADQIAATSTAAATEYGGWRTMLSGSGRTGPDIRTIGLVAEAGPSSPAQLEDARRLLGVGSLPIVLVVGSHEPRKNHLAVLHAADLVWRRGVDFTLAFIGGNSWASERFEARVASLQAQGRPVQVVRAVSDGLLWASYRVAHCTVFPSLHEGFGLPVPESLACGTPVITSCYGSMRELSVHGGTLLVDPRDDRDLARALERMIAEPGLRDRLAEEARAAPVRSWDEYAGQTWAYLVEEPLGRARRSEPVSGGGATA